jgi:uncharacterized protein (DUF2252 family)
LFAEPPQPPDRRRAAGKRRRAEVPRRSQASFVPSPDRTDPVDLMIEANQTRVAELVPVRVQRMAASPFAFFRGSALQMALDLAAGPVSGGEVTLCGDAHIANFGVFASPERRLVFDLNDFDEVARGPFEWDVKRLAASIVLAGRDRRLRASAVRRAVVEAVGGYARWMEVFSTAPLLDLFYAHIETTALMDRVRQRNRAQVRAVLDKAGRRDHQRALAKHAVREDGRWRIQPDPPLVVRIDDPSVEPLLDRVFTAYTETLAPDRRALLAKYRFVDFALKVVGVGSVGTRCWIVLLESWNGDPLFLQLKQARPAAPTVALGAAPADHDGRRIVMGQRALQAASDVLLGWTTDERNGAQYYVRQLWDAKGGVDVASLTAATIGPYAKLCGGALARAHARSGDPAFIAGYVGRSERFPDAMADFAEAYADQTERDHAALLVAIADGRLPAAGLADGAGR